MGSFDIVRFQVIYSGHDDSIGIATRIKRINVLEQRCSKPFTGKALSNDLLGSSPNARPAVLESPIIQVALLFRRLIDLNVRL